MFRLCALMLVLLQGIALSFGAPPASQPTVEGLDGAEIEIVSGAARQRYRLTALADAAPVPPPATVPAAEPKAPLNETDVPLSIFPTTGTAPCAVHVHALDVPLASGSPITATYEFDFGDPDGRFNTLRGFNAAHVYDRPGTYVIRVRVVDEDGNETIATRSIEILPSARRTIYVSADGSDNNPGTSPEQPIRSLAKADDLIAGDTAILLRRGDVFPLIGDLDIKGSNVLLGAYSAGDGANQDKPIIRKGGKRTGEPILSMDDGCLNVVVQDIAFDTTFTTDTEVGIPTAISPRGRNVVIRRCTFLNVGYAVNNNEIPRFVLIQDCDAPLETGMREYFSWVVGADHVIIGNTVANSTRQHIVRGSENFQRLLVAHNTFANIWRGDVGDPKDTAKTTLAIQQSQFTYIVGNTLTDGPVGIGPLSKGDGLKRPNYQAERTGAVVVEANRLIDTSLRIGHGSERVMVRNNVIRRDEGPAIEIEGYDTTYKRGVIDCRIVNNTAVNQHEKGQFLWLMGGARDLVVANNLYVAPKLTTGSHQTSVIYVAGEDLRAFKEIRNNVWPAPRTLEYAQGGFCYVWPKWSDSAGYLTPQEWSALPQVTDDVFENVTMNDDSAPAPDSRAVGFGKPHKGVVRDIDGKPRTGSTCTAGAVQIDP